MAIGVAFSEPWYLDAQWRCLVPEMLATNNSRRTQQEMWVLTTSEKKNGPTLDTFSQRGTKFSMLGTMSLKHCVIGLWGTSQFQPATQQFANSRQHEKLSSDRGPSWDLIGGTLEALIGSQLLFKPHTGNRSCLCSWVSPMLRSVSFVLLVSTASFWSSGNLTLPAS